MNIIEISTIANDFNLISAISLTNKHCVAIVLKELNVSQERCVQCSPRAI